jgi:hypothetical protein
MSHLKYATALSPMADFAYPIAFTPYFSFRLHATCRALHNYYTLHEKKKAARGKGPGFDGKLDDFQAPYAQLSSLAKLVSILLFGYCCLSQASDDSECCD